MVKQISGESAVVGYGMLRQSLRNEPFYAGPPAKRVSLRSGN